jgi:sigma-E factor negative regulatory protein RseB
LDVTDDVTDIRFVSLHRWNRPEHVFKTAAVITLAVSLLVLSQAYAADAAAPAANADASSWFAKIKTAARNLLSPQSEAEVWLGRIQDAAQKLNYSGTFVYQQGGQVQASRITHFVDQSGEYEKLEVLDGQPREYIRHNDDVRCYMPDSKTILQEKRVSSDLFPAVLAGSAEEIDAHYQFIHSGTERVGGRACNVVMLQPRDKLRYGYRLWSDQETGLLVKAQTLNERGDVIEQIAFTDLTIGNGIDKARTQPSVTSTENWRTEKFETVPANLTAAGWSVQSPVPGFRKILEIKRSFGQNHDVGQIVYSDGLAAISVFVESADAPGVAAGDANQGPINIVSRRQGNQWLTVIGEVPAISIRQVANSVEFKPPK